MTQAKWFVAASVAVVVATPAFAVGTPAERAAELLARAGAVDAKCHYLQGDEQDALSHLVARAELALANQVSVADTKATMARGRAAGAAASCTAAEKDNVHSILGEAQHSLQNADQPQQAAADPAPIKPIINQQDAPQPMPARQPIIRGTWNNNDQAENQPAQRHVGSDPRLSQYAMLTETYFVALRCGSVRDLSRMYQNIRGSHDELMQDHDGSELSYVVRRSKMRAASRGCY